MSDFTVLFWSWILCGLIGAAIGSTKGRSGAGFWFGLLLGPLGWLLVAVGPDLRKKVPEQNRDPINGPAVQGLPPEGAVASPPPLPTPTDSILALKKLLDAGAITPEEYEAKKKSLLEKI